MNKVLIEKCEQYKYEDVYKVIEDIFHTYGLNDRIQKDMKIVLKANMVMKSDPAKAATTHPVVVQAIAEKVKSLGAKPLICDSPGGFYDKNSLNAVYNLCGYSNILSDGIELNYDTSSTEVKFDGKSVKSILTINPILEADLVINIPKLKTHGMMIMTAAVKNFFGIVPGLEKAKYHASRPNYTDFADALIDICLSVKNQFTIMDAIYGMEGDGPTAGEPKKIGLIIAGENPFAIDLMCADIIGLRDDQIYINKNMIDRKIIFRDEVETIGEKISDVKLSEYKYPSTLGKINAKKWYWALMEKGLKFMMKKPRFVHEKCTSCGECAKCCPMHCITFKDKKPYADYKKCISCFCCHELCPYKAIDIK